MTDASKIGLDRISPSALQCYEDCPKNFYYSCWLGLQLPEKEERHMKFGTAIHETLDFLYSNYDRNFNGGWQGFSFDLLQEEFERKWKPSMITDYEFCVYKQKKNSPLNSKKELYEDMFDDGIEMLKSYWEEKDVLMSNGVDVYKTEIPIRVPLLHPVSKKPLPIPLSLRIDGLTTSGSIVEFKTSSGKYVEEETRRKIQGLSYSFVKYQETGRVPRVHYVILLKGKAKERIQHITLDFDEADMQAYWNRVNATLQKILNREFERSRIGHMPYCDCYKFDELLNVK